MTNPEASYRRAIAQPFTDATPKHHPFLDPDLPDEDIPLVPNDLVPRGGLRWTLPTAPATPATFDVAMLRATMGQMRENLSLMEDWVVVWAEGNGRIGEAFSRTREPALASARGSVVSADTSRNSDVVEAIRTPSEGSDFSELSDQSYVLVAREKVRNRGASKSGLSSNLNVSRWSLVESADPTTGPVGRQQDRAPENPTADKGTVPANLQSVELESDGHLVRGFSVTGIGDTDRAMLRPLGPYDAFWLRNDIYGQRKKRSVPELRRKAGSMELRTENRKSL